MKEETQEKNERDKSKPLELMMKNDFSEYEGVLTKLSLSKMFTSPKSMVNILPFQVNAKFNLYL